MRFNRLITHGAVAVGLYVVIGAGSPGSDGPPPSPAGGYYERWVGAIAPALSLRPEEPAAGDSPLRRLTKLRFASALRRLEIAAQRVKYLRDAPTSSSRSSRTSANRGLSCAMTHRPSSPCWKRARARQVYRRGQGAAGSRALCQTQPGRRALRPVGRRGATRSGEGRAEGSAAGPCDDDPRGEFTAWLRQRATGPDGVHPRAFGSRDPAADAPGGHPAADHRRLLRARGSAGACGSSTWAAAPATSRCSPPSWSAAPDRSSGSIAAKKQSPWPGDEHGRPSSGTSTSKRPRSGPFPVSSHSTW